MDRWKVYEYIKLRNGQVTVSEVLNEFHDVSLHEVAEGIAEYCQTYGRLSEGA